MRSKTSEFGVALAIALLLLPTAALANDFPTQTRVEYVLRCMESHGGQNYDTLYPCTCSIDKIAREFTFEEYIEAEVFAYLRSTPGERGGMFRDTDRARELAKKFREVTAAAEKSCFVAKR